MFSENRFNEPKNTQEVDAPVEKKEDLTETELREREAELKRRYEDPYRNEQAKRFSNERNRLREQERKKVEALQAELSSSHATSNMLEEGELSNFVQFNNFLSGQLHAGQVQRAALVKKKEERGIFQKLKYSFVEDPLNEALQSLSQVEARHIAEIEDN